MSQYLAILGRQPEISLAELESLYPDARTFAPGLAVFTSASTPSISRLGGTMKLARELDVSPLDYLMSLPEGKITLGFSDYSSRASRKSATLEALKLKKILMRHGRSVRVLENKDAILSTATSHHNQISEKKNHIELIKTNQSYYTVIGVQNITAYAHRDQARPARDARVGMLPPKLAQILINLCGPLEKDSIILDPFCGTGVVLQEALLMDYRVLGTDLEPRMIDYTKKNLDWLESRIHTGKPVTLEVGDATSHAWHAPIDAVACETYLGPPMSVVPPEIKLRTAKDACRPIILGFLRNLSSQINEGTPVVLAIPAWLREDGTYSRLDILDEIQDMGYNVRKRENSGNIPLLYHREGQIVARELIILRKN